MAIFKELKEFMMRGSVIDLAVGVVIGGAFGQIVNSLVNDVIMPPIGYVLDGVDFKDLKYVIKESYEKAGTTIPEVSLNYGSFIQTVINFIIIATAIFFMVKAVSSLKKKKEDTQATPPAPSKEEVLLAEIRDLLKSNNNNQSK